MACRTCTGFATGGGLSHFEISDDGMTATRKAGHGHRQCFVCALPRFETGMFPLAALPSRVSSDLERLGTAKKSRQKRSKHSDVPFVSLWGLWKPSIAFRVTFQDLSKASKIVHIIQTPHHTEPCSLSGVHEVTFRIDERDDWFSLMGIGIVSTSKISRSGAATDAGYVYRSDGAYYAEGRRYASTQPEYDVGDSSPCASTSAHGRWHSARTARSLDLES